ncbi:hypothetical protein BN2476_210122 [Paraburkholderia piptadeniae]|uniref:Uncharacterized protein n=1 Tax=Paraburkholderia piptadeniae TaxID=1701573 RepID=A0A1N7RVZ7_9BURK|nr:hypothetical protein BN2476_210122 [Paraburkholderia piptadeniae]
MVCLSAAETYAVDALDVVVTLACCIHRVRELGSLRIIEHAPETVLTYRCEFGARAGISSTWASFLILS